MKLTDGQLAQYRADGFLVLDKLFSQEEVGWIRAEIDAAGEIDDDRVVREKTGEVRAIYGVHDLNGPTGSQLLERMVRSGRLLDPVKGVVQDDVYVFHTQCNFKEAIRGAIWPWHQDFDRWEMDGTPLPRMVTALLFLDKATEISGCLYVVKGTHKLGNVRRAEIDANHPGGGFFVVPKEKMIEYCAGTDPIPLLGDPGTVVLFHPELIHGSGHNMSIRDRRQLYIVYNAVSNALQDTTELRPEYKATRSGAPLHPLMVDALREPAEAMTDNN